LLLVTESKSTTIYVSFVNTCLTGGLIGFTGRSAYTKDSLGSLAIPSLAKSV